MDNVRKGEIALLMIKQKIRREGVILNPESLRDIKNQADKLGVPLEEAVEFLEVMTRELVEEMFAKKDELIANAKKGVRSPKWDK
jgi:hypothetical protein